MALEAWDRLVAAVRALTTPSDTQMVDLRRGTTIEFASIDINNLGSNLLVATDGARKIKSLLSYVLVSEGTVAVRWVGTDGVTPVDLSGPMPLIVNTGIAMGGGNAPGTHWELETTATQNLHLSLSVICGVRGHLAYFREA